MVKQWNSDGVRVWCYSATVLVEQWKSDGGKVEIWWWNSIAGTVEQ